MTCGTPGYCSPEQARGEELDPRSDLYSVGVLLYELVSGRLPFEAATPGALVAKMLVEPPLPLRQRRPDLVVPADLEAVIMRALAHGREARFASAEAFRRDLLACSATGERPAPALRAQATAVLNATPGGAPRAPPRPGQPPTPRPGHSPAAAAAGSSARRPVTPPHHPTPRHRAARSPARRAVPEAAGALAVILASVVGALLLGAGVWYGLSWLRTPSTQAATPLEIALLPPVATAPASPVPAPQPVAAPAPGPLRSLPAAGSGDPEGVLTILGTPGSLITVDGRPAGQAPRELRLPPGAHRLRLTHSAAGAAEETIQVEPGQRQAWNPTQAR